MSLLCAVDRNASEWTPFRMKNPFLLNKKMEMCVIENKHTSSALKALECLEKERERLEEEKHNTGWRSFVLRD